MSKKKIHIINGPNLNLLGSRQPEIYGSQTLDDIEQLCSSKAKSLGFEIVFLQSNAEGELVELIQEAGATGSGIIINAAAYTHTSIAILDALKACDVVCIEVHLSNVFAREEFRHKSYVSQAVTGMICGFGARGYELALEALAEHVEI